MLNIHGEAIYGTRICEPYSIGNYHFTRKGDTTYAFYLYKDDQEVVEEELYIPMMIEFSRIDLVGGQDKLDYRRIENGIVVRMPETELQIQAPIAHVFRIQ
ncbi:alpha-L-fucosidase [Paenibacillus pini JCM 16418]|uniref:Alpha-L-fucosidase n=1 Tax=Paenibacillus pini JCM 16418 TaxID=1236976 RepID=W7YV57_9BACL|nr:alpha-L-fucosidase [Paenibacillus pini JCM 16418]